MSRELSQQEQHNLAMNIVGKELESKGFEFIAINSKLKKHPQFVCTDSNNNRHFVIVQVGKIADTPVSYDVIWMESFKSHARSQNAKVLYAGVGLGSKNDKHFPPRLNEPYLLQYEGLEYLDIEMN